MNCTRDDTSGSLNGLLSKDARRTGDRNEDSAFRDYGNIPLQMVGTMAVTLESNGWKIHARIKVIGGNHPSTIGRDMMP